MRLVLIVEHQLFTNYGTNTFTVTGAVGYYGLVSNRYIHLSCASHNCKGDLFQQVMLNIILLLLLILLYTLLQEQCTAVMIPCVEIIMMESHQEQQQKKLMKEELKLEIDSDRCRFYSIHSKSH